MKKIICLFMMMTLLFSSSPAFAYSQQVEFELDARVTPLLTIDLNGPPTFAGDVTFASDGTILLQEVEFNDMLQFDGPGQEEAASNRLLLKRLSQDGQTLAQADLVWDSTPYDYLPYSFIAEDPNGLIYSASHELMFALDASMTKQLALPQGSFPTEDSFEVDAKDQSILISRNLMKSFCDIGEEELMDLNQQSSIDYLILAKLENEDDNLLTSMVAQPIEPLLVLLGENTIVVDVDFAQTTDTIYALVYDRGSEMSPIQWKIAKIKVSIISTEHGEGLGFQLLDSVPLEGVPESVTVTGYEFDGNTHQVIFYPDPIQEERQEASSLRQSSLNKYDKAGCLTDSIQLPGRISAFDAKGNQSLVALNSAHQTSNAGHYMITWQTQEVGRPQALIQERTLHHQTLAVFRDKGYGLLRKEDRDTGIIDYLAPLKTEEDDVLLRIPLSDVLSKIQANARYLEILYGEDRIDIPMSNLDVADLLQEMPCQSDATIELHISRGENGSLQISGDLFVVEQVDDITKCVHRLPIALK